MDFGEGVVVEVELEAVKKEIGWFEASTLVRDFPIGKVGVDMSENED